MGEFGILRGAARTTIGTKPLADADVSGMGYGHRGNPPTSGTSVTQHAAAANRGAAVSPRAVDRRREEMSKFQPVLSPAPGLA